MKTKKAILLGLAAAFAVSGSAFGNEPEQNAASSTAEKSIIRFYKAIENGVVTGYMAIENGVVSGYKAVENFFVNTFSIQKNANMPYESANGDVIEIFIPIEYNVYKEQDKSI